KNPDENQNPDQQNIKEKFVKDPQKFTRRVLADRCRIIGTVKEIDSTRFIDNPEAPCGKYPCFAVITLNEILAYGSGFAPKLYPGQELIVQFKFTLEPTNKIAPEMQLQLPGLEPGDTFIADLEALPAIGENKVQYTIFRYELKEE
ncbi:MAG: hypothetical protein P8X42_19315, partial [Calditrichaceae bacterium]